MDRVDLMKQIWENHRSETGGSLTGLDRFFKGYLISLYHTCPKETSYMELLLDFQDTFPEWQIQKEQLLVYWLYTYFCGADDEKIFAKGKMAVICTLFIEELVLDSMPGNGKNWNQGISDLSVIDSPGNWNTRIRT